jgi:hypothetical protein
MTAVEITSVPLTEVEESRLTELERIVESGLARFVKVGTALAEIRDGKLYRQTHATFDDYLADRWEISSSRGYQLISAARVSTIVETAGLPPVQNEAQARELSGLRDPRVREVWQQAVAETAGRPTAAAVARAKDKVVSAPKRPRRSPLPDIFEGRSYELYKAAASLQRATADDRWSSNVESCRARAMGGINTTITALNLVVQALGMGTLVLLTSELDTMSAASEDDFEAALARARAEGDLSAGNVAAKLVPDAVQDAPSATVDPQPPPAHTRSARQPITVVSGPNTAFCGYEFAVSAAIKRLGIPAMPDPDHRVKRRCISAKFLDDLVAALEADGHLVEVVADE